MKVVIEFDTWDARMVKSKVIHDDVEQHEIRNILFFGTAGDGWLPIYTINVPPIIEKILYGLIDIESLVVKEKDDN